MPLARGDILDWFESACRRFPGEICISWGERRVRYAELEEQVGRAGQCLQAASVGRGDVAAVLLPDRVELIAAMIALFRRGSVFVPLDPGEPGARLHATLRDAGPSVLLTDARLHGWVRNARDETAPGAAVIDVGSGLIDPGRPEKVVTPGQPGVAYLQYTSGSTGQPRGVMGSLAALSHFIRWEVETFGIAPGWRVSQFMRPTFDAFFRDVFVPLCTGGTVCIPEVPPFESTPENLARWLNREAVELVHAVPALLAALADAETGAGELPALRRVLVAGEALRPLVVRRWWRRFGRDATLVNLYGATETTMVKLFHVVRPEDLERPVVPIGKGMEGAEALVLDEARRICPPGAIGEIHIRSPHLALGYYRNAEATRAAYVPDPFRSEPGAVLYRTGDLGVQRAGGLLEFVGRGDDVVKIRGSRVALGEIEAALERYPGLGEAAVVCLPDGSGENRLVAHVAAAIPDPISPADIRVHLRSYLTRERIPGSFVFHQALPRTPNGKVDRQALALLGAGESRQSADPVAPRNAVERELSEIWSELLGLDSVGVHDHFLDLGGHSITAVRVASRWAHRTGTELPVAAIFEHPTIAELADWIGRSDASAGRPALEAGAGSGHRGPCNLVIVVNALFGRLSFERLAREVEAADPLVRAIVVDDAPGPPLDPGGLPTLVFAPAAIRHPGRFPGRHLCGEPLTKSAEYAALEAEGFPVPRWRLLTQDHQSAPSEFGRYVVCKPDEGGKGAAVRLRQAARLRWRPVFTGSSGLSSALIVQEYIHTGPRPTSYRVTTLFGETLYAVKVTAGLGRPPVPSPEEMGAGKRFAGVSIVSNTPDSELELTSDLEVIALAEAAHGVFPVTPLLGVDILREAGSGRLFIVEVNAIGYNWNFAGSGARSFGIPLEEQFDGLRKAARILAERARRMAE